MCYGPIGHGRSNGGVRGCKASVFEGGIRVPGIIQFPAEITEHRDIDVMFERGVISLAIGFQIV